MTEAAQIFEPSAAVDTDAIPFVVIGNGPVGMRVVRELLERVPAHLLVM